jgi:hypothetical protein
VDALSFVGRGFRSHLHDHGGRHDVLSSSREDRCFRLALLDLVVHTACPCPRALSVIVLQARASVVMAFVGLLGFTGPGSF